MCAGVRSVLLEKDDLKANGTQPGTEGEAKKTGAPEGGDSGAPRSVEGKVVEFLGTLTLGQWLFWISLAVWVITVLIPFVWKFLTGTLGEGFWKWAKWATMAVFLAFLLGAILTLKE